MKMRALSLVPVPAGFQWNVSPADIDEFVFEAPRQLWLLEMAMLSLVLPDITAIPPIPEVELEETDDPGRRALIEGKLKQMVRSTIGELRPTGHNGQISI